MKKLTSVPNLNILSQKLANPLTNVSLHFLIGIPFFVNRCVNVLKLLKIKRLGFLKGFQRVSRGFLWLLLIISCFFFAKEAWGFLGVSYCSDAGAGEARGGHWPINPIPTGWGQGRLFPPFTNGPTKVFHLPASLPSSQAEFHWDIWPPTFWMK